MINRNAPKFLIVVQLVCSCRFRINTYNDNNKCVPLLLIGDVISNQLNNFPFLFICLVRLKWARAARSQWSMSLAPPAGRMWYLAGWNGLPSLLTNRYEQMWSDIVSQHTNVSQWLKQKKKQELYICQSVA